MQKWWAVIPKMVQISIFDYNSMLDVASYSVHTVYRLGGNMSVLCMYMWMQY